MQPWMKENNKGYASPSLPSKTPLFGFWGGSASNHLNVTELGGQILLEHLARISTGSYYSCHQYEYWSKCCFCFPTYIL